jgi:hypothetical protein
VTDFETSTRAFIVRIWLERREMEGATPEWRGVIEYISTGERKYFNQLTEIATYLALHLRAMGIPLDLK